MSEVAPEYERCPASRRGDLQLEVVLTPLLFLRKPIPSVVSHTPHDTQPELRLLDIGCGAGRLAAALAGFPQHILDHVTYVGCEADASAAEAAAEEISRIKDLPEFHATHQVLESARVESFDDLFSSPPDRSSFDIAFVVNVLHHVAAGDLPLFLSHVLASVSDGGYLVLHDFYFGGDGSEADHTKYCDGCVFFSPLHFSAMFAMASTQTGNYRVVQRTSRVGRYDLFTLILHVENELSDRVYEESAWDDDYFSYLDIPPAIDLALEHHREEAATWKRSAWTEEYELGLLAAQEQFATAWPHRMRSSPAAFAAAQWLGLASSGSDSSHS